ncbi:MAG: transcriptional regulator, ArsR family [Thermoplasmatales archaeon Gpl]|nr:MAG: transcriptional regulator, ArsR family [Thermoplasmatales archaeon Gpl]
MTDETDPRTILIHIIESEPGLHFRALQRKTGMAVGQLEYHLYKLEKEDEIMIRKDGRYKRYFLIASSDNTRKILGYHLRNKVSRNVIMLLLRKKEMNLETLNEKIKDAQKLNDAIKVLLSDNIIIRENDQFSLNNPSSVKEYIRKSRKSFLEELSDSLIDMLDEE